VASFEILAVSMVEKRELNCSNKKYSGRLVQTEYGAPARSARFQAHQTLIVGIPLLTGHCKSQHFGNLSP